MKDDLIRTDTNPDNWIRLDFKIHKTEYEKCLQIYKEMGELFGDNNTDYPLESFFREWLMSGIEEHLDPEEHNAASTRNQNDILKIIKNNPGISPRQVHDIITNEDDYDAIVSGGIKRKK